MVILTYEEVFDGVVRWGKFSSSPSRLTRELVLIPLTMGFCQLHEEIFFTILEGVVLVP